MKQKLVKRNKKSATVFNSVFNKQAALTKLERRKGKTLSLITGEKDAARPHHYTVPANFTSLLSQYSIESN